MTERLVVIGDNERLTYTSSLNATEIEEAEDKYLEGLLISIDALQNTTTALTLANGLGTINPFRVKVGSKTLIEITGEELYALNHLWLANVPFGETSGGDNETAYLGALFLPVYLPRSRFMPSGKAKRKVYVESDFTAWTNGDTERLTVQGLMLDGNPSGRPGTIKISRVSKNTGSGTGSSSYDDWVHNFQPEGKLIGILYRATTLPGGGTVITAGGARSIQHWVNGELIDQFNFFKTTSGIPNLTRGQHWTPLWDNPADTTLLDNFRWRPFAREPILPNSTVQIKVQGGVASENFRAIIVEAI